MGALLRETLKQFPGKGGGAKDFAQGSLANLADTDSVLVHAKKQLGP
jgi:alanyl-tRNA synthetase